MKFHQGWPAPKNPKFLPLEKILPAPMAIHFSIVCHC